MLVDKIDNKQAMRVIAYMIAIVLANLLVLYLGALGLVFTALFLIPFDFVLRCTFHESLKGWRLILFFFVLVCVASIITYGINANAKAIALGSIGGLVSATIASSIFYQLNIKRKAIVKVNGSDIVAIICDTIVFQLLAFGVVDWNVTAGQVLMKAAGGFFWYWILFVKYPNKFT